MPAEGRLAPVAAIDVVVGGVRIRIESAVPGLTARRLARVFPGHAAPPRPRPDARLRILPAPPPRAWLEPARLRPRAAAALRPIPARLRGRRFRRRELHDGLAALLTPVAAAAERELARARAPVAFPWGNGAFVGDLARPSGTLFLSQWRSSRDLRFPLLNAHGLLLAAVAAGRGGLLVHSGAVVSGGRAYLLVGRSGVGKSTLSRRARGAALSDDGVLVVPHRGRLLVAATPLRQQAPTRPPRGPWPAGGTPLGGVLLLRQARVTALRLVRPAAALTEIVSRHLHFLALLPPALAARALGNAAALLATAPAHRLAFTRDADVREVLGAGRSVGRRLRSPARSGILSAEPGTTR